MAQTIGQCINELENWEYSQEAYEFKKECMELNLVNQYIENQCFTMETAVNDETVTFTEGFLMESAGISAIYEAETAATKKGENVILKFVKMIGKAFKTFFGWIGKFFKMLISGIAAGVLAAAILLGIVKGAKPDDNGNITLPENIVEQITSEANKASDTLGHVTVEDKGETIVVKSEKVSAPIIVKKNLANANKLWTSLNNIYNSSGLGSAGVRVKDLKNRAKKSVSFENFNASPWKSPKGQPYSLGELVFVALTENPIVFNTMSGTQVMTLEDTTTIYKMIIESINKEQWEFNTINSMITECTHKCVRDGLTINIDEESMNKTTEIMNNISKALPAATEAISKKMAAARNAIQEAVELLTEGRGDNVRNRKAVFQAQGQKEVDRILGKQKDPHQQKPEEAKQLAHVSALPTGLPKNAEAEMNRCMTSMTKITAAVMKINSSLLTYRKNGLKAINSFLSGNDGAITVAEAS